MNNKGFGLQELLVFIGIFLFMLVSITIYWNAKIGSNSFYDEPDVQVEKNNDEVEPTKIEIPKEYIKMENDLENAAKNLSIDKSNDKVITLNQLQNNNLIGKLIDPNDTRIECNGYVVYTSNIDKYKAYINCTGMYITDAYDSNLEK